MGLFSGKTKISVSSVAYNIAGDASDRADFLKQSLIYLNAADQSIGERLPRMYLQSLGLRLNRAYKYAAAMPQGLPTSSMQLWEYQEFEAAVQTMLDIEHGPGRFKVEDAYITGSNTAPTVENYLNKKYGWDSVTGLMSRPPAGFPENADLTWAYEPPQEMMSDASPQLTRSFTVELRHVAGSEDPDLVVKISQNAVEHFSDNLLVAMVSEYLSTVRSDTTTTRPFMAGDVTGTTSTTTLATAGARVTETVTTTTTTTDGTNTTIQVRIVDTTTSETKSHEYAIGIGEWPVLDTIWANHTSLEQTFFPSIPFRVDNQDMLAEKYEGTDNYKQIGKLCSLMGLNAHTINNQINDNPSIKDIDYAFLVAGANMNTKSQAEMDYLFRFWELCLDRQTATESDHTSWVGMGPAARPKPKTNSLTIQDPQSKNGAYKIDIEWDFIKKVTVAGLIGPDAKRGQFRIVSGATVEYEMTGTSNRWQVDSTVVSIRKQITDTHYEEIQITGAVHKNDVYQGKVVETLARDSRSKPEENGGFLVPLHMGIFNSMPLTKRTQLAQECLYLVFNCYVKTKKKWYQTGIFKIVLAIVLIVVTAVSWGTGAPGASAVWGAVTVAAAIGAVGVGVALVGIALSFVYGYLLSYILGKWAGGIESVFGKKWAGVVTAVINIVVAYFTGGRTMFSGNSFLTTAVSIIDIASQLFAGYAKGVSLQRQSNFDAFMDQVKEDQNRLEQLSTSFFGESDLVSIDYLLHLQKTLREDSPSVFLSRTLLVGSDVVDVTLGMVSEMVNIEITPRLQGVG